MRKLTTASALAVASVVGGCAILAELDDHVGSASDGGDDVATLDATAEGGDAAPDARPPACAPLLLGAHRHGDVDETFGRSGIATYEGHTAAVTGIVVDRQGRIAFSGLVLDTGTGFATHPGVGGFLTDGSPDPRFDDGMTVFPDLLGSSEGITAGIAIDPDDGLALAGSTGFLTLPDGGVIIRLTSDGKPNAQYGSNGISVSPAGAPNGRKGYSSISVFPGANDRSLIVAGNVYASGDAGFVLSRYSPIGFPLRIGGALEVSGFLDGGIAARAMVRTESGAVLIVALPNSSPYLGYVRYSIDGGLDPTFGLGAALAIRDAGGGDAAATVDASADAGGTDGDSGVPNLLSWPAGAVEDAQHRIVVTGQIPITKKGVAERGVGVARILPDGRFDPSFGIGGFASIPVSGAFHDEGLAVAMDPDGSHIVVAAYTADAAFTAANPDAGKTPGTVALLRLDDAGKLDAQFGTGGISLARFGASDGGAQLFNLVPSSIAWDPCRERWIVSANVKLVSGQAYAATISFHR